MLGCLVGLVSVSSAGNVFHAPSDAPHHLRLKVRHSVVGSQKQEHIRTVISFNNNQTSHCLTCELRRAADCEEVREMNPMERMPSAPAVQRITAQYRCSSSLYPG